MLDQDFCSYLEYQISNVLENSRKKDLKRFWCDGILLPDVENEYSQKRINNTRKVAIRAFIGNDGQSEYKLPSTLEKNL